MAIRHGSRVRLHYRIALEDGTVVDESFDAEPLELRLGDGTLLPNLERHLLGLSPGERKTFILDPQEAFGFADTGAIHRLPKGQFPADFSLEPGTLINFATPGGEETPGMIIKVEGEEVTVDFNHPLAGRTIVFTVEILQIQG